MTFTAAGRDEAAARRLMTAQQWAFVAGAAGDGSVPAANRAAWQQVRLTHQHPVDVSLRSTSARVLGHNATLPLAVAPMGSAGRVREQADLEIAVAAREAGVPVVVSTFASSTIEDIAGTGTATAFQLYWLKDAGKRRELVRRAEQAGCSRLVVTVDCPARVGSDLERHAELAPVAAAMTCSKELDPSLVWEDVAELAESVSIPVVVKGVLSRDSAHQAAAIRGVDGIVVSNHGGRQLDSAAPSAQVLPEVVDEVRFAAALSPMEVLVDSGIRSGWDMLRALMLGADGVLIGRPIMFALAAGGATSVLALLQRYRTELDAAMTSAGVCTVEQARTLPFLAPGKEAAGGV